MSNKKDIRVANEMLKLMEQFKTNFHNLQGMISDDNTGFALDTDEIFDNMGTAEEIINDFILAEKNR